MDKLNTTQWNFFKFSDIFIIMKGRRLVKEDMIEGGTNYIGAIAENNGVRQKISNMPMYEGNCITVNYNGSVGEAFYQRNPFWASDDVNVLFLKDREMTEEIALFLCTIIKKEKYRFSYGRKWNMESMKTSELFLPEKNGAPDWEVMQTYIINIKEEKLKIAIDKMDTNNTKENRILHINDWTEFKLTDIFEITIAKSQDYICLEEGKIKYVGRISGNNGVQGKVSSDVITKKGAITISMVGTYEAFWQEEDFVASQNILVLRNNQINKYSALFICTIIKKMHLNLHSYNRPVQKKKISEIKIKLPSNGKIPDYKYMEFFIKKLPYGDKI